MTANLETSFGFSLGHPVYPGHVLESTLQGGYTERKLDGRVP